MLGGFPSPRIVISTNYMSSVFTVRYHRNVYVYIMWSSIMLMSVLCLTLQRCYVDMWWVLSHNSRPVSNPYLDSGVVTAWWEFESDVYRLLHYCGHVVTWSYKEATHVVWRSSWRRITDKRVCKTVVTLSSEPQRRRQAVKGGQITAWEEVREDQNHADER